MHLTATCFPWQCENVYGTRLFLCLLNVCTFLLDVKGLDRKLEQPKRISRYGSATLSGQTVTKFFACPVQHNEKLILVPIRFFDYDLYRALYMFDQPRFIGSNLGWGGHWEHLPR